MPERISIFPRKKQAAQRNSRRTARMSAVFFEQRFNKHKSLWKGRDGVWGREGKSFLQKKLFPPFVHQPCFLKLFLGRERQKASTTRAMVTQNMMAESALMSGFTPSRTIE